MHGPALHKPRETGSTRHLVRRNLHRPRFRDSCVASRFMFRSPPFFLSPFCLVLIKDAYFLPSDGRASTKERRKEKEKKRAWNIFGKDTSWLYLHWEEDRSFSSSYVTLERGTYSSSTERGWGWRGDKVAARSKNRQIANRSLCLAKK